MELHAHNHMPDLPRACRALCRMHVKMNHVNKGQNWCEELLDMEGRQDDADRAIGTGQALFECEQWEDMVRVLERAFEVGGTTARCVLFHCSESNVRRLS